MPFFSEREGVFDFLRTWRDICQDLGDLINRQNSIRPNIESSLTMFQNEVQRMQDNNFSLVPVNGPNSPHPSPPADQLLVPILARVAHDLADGIALNSSIQTPQPGPSSAPDGVVPLGQTVLLRNIANNVVRRRFDENRVSFISFLLVSL